MAVAVVPTITGASVIVAHAGSLGVWHISKGTFTRLDLGVPGCQSFLATCSMNLVFIPSSRPWTT